MIISILAALSVLCWRRPDMFLNAQFRAEDGSIFFVDAFYVGLPSLWKTYGGYFHLYPRMVALVCEWLPLPYRYFPLVYNTGWLSGLFLCVIYLWKIPHISPGMKGIFSVLLVLVPAGNEAMANLTNAQWILALWILIYALGGPSEKKWQNMAGYGLLLISGLTTPLSVIFPLVFIIAYILSETSRVRRHQLVNVVLMSITGLLQLTALFITSGRMDSRINDHQVNWTDIRFLKLVKDQYVYVFTGNTSLLDGPEYTVPLFAGVVVFLAVVLVILVRQKNTMALLLYTGGLLTLGAVMFESRHFLSDIHPYGGGARYFYIPAYTLLCSLVLLLDFYKKKAWRWVSYLLLLWTTGVTFRSFSPQRFSDRNWSEYAERMQNGETLDVPIEPEGWSFHFEPGRRESN